MKRMFITIGVLLVLILSGSIKADIKINGDMRIRPRLDIKDNGLFGDKSTDSYYYYRARLSFKSDLSEGWFGHVQLGTNGYGYFTGKFGDTKESGASLPNDGISLNGASRGPVDFMLVYFGRKTESFGYIGGLIPVNGITNPMLDLHYYSDRMVDVPYFLFNNNGAHGFSGYVTIKDKGRINASIFVDNNDGSKVEDSLGVITKDIVDQYTLMIDLPLKISDFVVQPTLLFSMLNDDNSPTPLTIGVGVTSPPIGRFKLHGSFGNSSQEVNGVKDYTAWHARAKLTGKLTNGTLVVWYDKAKKTFELAGGDRVHDFGYLWLSYSIPLLKNENGTVSIKPTWRHITEKVSTNSINSKDFMRDKIEITIDYYFN